MSSKFTNTKLIKDETNRLGFMYCGVSKAGFLEEEAPRLEQWLNKNMHGSMAYMERNFDKRLDPTKLVPGAKSVVSLLLNYFPSELQRDDAAPKISKYALGKDYHFVVKDKLKDFMSRIHEEIGEVGGRVFVDSAPVMERQWAAKSGLGWLGKNSLLLNKQRGSFYFLAELIIDLELEEDGPMQDYCGTCTKCIDACPTDAIVGDGIVDASKCISYLTIELKDDLSRDFADKMEDWVFGCDICQDVCPWNRFSKPHQEEAFQSHSLLTEMDKKDWEEMPNSSACTKYKGDLGE
ncbi:MAG: tRNA epoxyqueuosine(34) reductase QueG [Bacteroidetes bacterium]|nr:MAG: tRNA epoxyqueuosine(34) reductase QueG [Bacteroidota bacterium]